MIYQIFKPYVLTAIAGKVIASRHEKPIALGRSVTQEHKPTDSSSGIE